MPLPIICAYEYVQQYLMSYRDLFSKPQYKYFVIVLLGFIQCQQARTLSGLQRGVAEAGSLSGLSRFFAEAPWDAEALVARWQERFRTQMMPVVQAELTRQHQVHPKRRGRPKQRVRGHSLVQGLYVLGERHCPVAPRLYRQQHVCEREQVPFQSKIDLMIEAIQSFEPVAGTRTHVLLDSWYGAKAIWKAARERDFLITTGLKNNCSLRIADENQPDGWRWQRLSDYAAALSTEDYIQLPWPRGEQAETVYVHVTSTRVRKLYCCQVIIVRRSLQEPLSQARYWASSDLEASAERLLEYISARCSCPAKKNVIERASQKASACGLPLWNQDEAGPYATRPQPGASWHLQGHPKLQPNEYLRDGGAKLMTLFCPATGEVRAKGVRSVTTAVLHPWLQEQLLSILESEEEARKQEGHQPAPLEQTEVAAQCQQWETWLGWRLSERYPPLRMILVWDNLAGHRSDKMVSWLFAHGIMPLYTPLGGSWLNMAESIQRILVRRALCGQYPQTQEQIIEWLEQTVAGWNQNPTPFVWNGKRRERRQRARLKRLAGSGAAVLSYAS